MVGIYSNTIHLHNWKKLKSPLDKISEELKNWVFLWYTLINK